MQITKKFQYSVEDNIPETRIAEGIETTATRLVRVITVEHPYARYKIHVQGVIEGTLTQAELDKLIELAQLIRKEEKKDAKSDSK